MSHATLGLDKTRIAAYRRHDKKPGRNFGTWKEWYSDTVVL